MMSRAVVTHALPQLDQALLLKGPSTRSRGKDLHGCERLGRPRPGTIERKPALLAGFNVHQNVVVLLPRRLTLPIEIRRIVGGQFDGRSAWENRVLLGAAAAQHQVF